VEFNVDVDRFLVVEIDGDDVTVFTKETSDVKFDINLDYNLVEKNT